MLRKYFSFIFPYCIFFLLTCILFQPYITQRKVPFPGSLLASFYQPYRSYSWKGYPTGIPNKQVGFDDIRIYYPLRTFTNISWKNFSIPLWNPYYFSGNVQLATYQSVVFFPLSFLYFILPQIDAWSLIIFLAPFLTMVSMYIFLEKSLPRVGSLSRSYPATQRASILGAIGFGLSGYILANTEDIYMAVYAAMFLPIILLGIRKVYEKNTLTGFLCVALGVVGTVFSGWFQVSVYILLFAAAYSIYVFFNSKKSIRQFSLVCFAFFLGITASAMQILPTIEAYASSVRGTTDVRNLFEIYLVPWYHLVTYVAPDFFGNPGTYTYFGGGSYSEKVLFVSIPILVLALYTVWSTVFKRFHVQKIAYNHDVSFYIFGWVVSLFLGFSSAISWFLLYTLHIPLFSTMLPSRIFILSAFATSYLAAYGIYRYEKKRETLPMVFSIVLTGSLLLVGWMMVTFAHRLSSLQQVFEFFISLQKGLANVAVAKKNLLLPTFFYFLTIGGIAVGMLKKFAKNSYYILLILVMVSGVYFANKYFLFSDREFTFPQLPVLQKLQQIGGNDRVWSAGNAHIERNFLVQYQIQSPEGYDALSSGRYAELLYAAGKNGVLTPAETPRADAVIPGAKNITDVASNPLRLKLLSLLGVKYIVGTNTGQDALVTSLPFVPVWHDKKFVIYRFMDSYPRAFFIDKVIVQKDKQKILTTLFSPQTDLRKTAIIEQTPLLSGKNTPLSATVHSINYTPNAISIQTYTNKPAMLILSDNYFPGWQAYVDGKPTAIYRVDYSFRGVVVPEGNHAVQFVYRPTSVSVGLFVSGISIGLMFCICIFLIKKRI